ncbi:MAG: YggS family pyridoxal phosphate-dependent enzyme [Marinilabiliales bacterium]|nr:MAG: YggS family pyridoxal phosphate-dependent enzyme [Marinilabiliales bacterium]
MGLIANNINDIKQQLSDKVKLVAVSKTHPVEYIVEAYNAGQRIFGENKVQEMTAKYEMLKDYDIKWHLIGHLQTNKVKYIAEFVDLIHSVDSLKLLKEINKQAKKHNRVINCLIQFHIASEETKFGLDYAEASQILDSEDFKQFENVHIVGVMGMASFTDDKQLIKKEFSLLRNTYNKLKNDYFSSDKAFCELSMGMSSDWKIAIEEGSTIIRVGSIIFGNRNYNL